MTEAVEINRRARSNLAFALPILPPDRREDAMVFYAFCRVVDDLADDLTRPLGEREEGLAAWEEGFRHGFARSDGLQRQVESLVERRGIPPELMIAVVEGCRMDLRPQRFGTWEDLSKYTWKVACAVGLAAMRIFGAKDPATGRYAVALGHALQLTNILRDVDEDLSNGGRIYLPLADLQRFQYTEGDLFGRVHDGRFVALMAYEAQRAEKFYREAEKALGRADRHAMVAAEVMREIYSRLLGKMKAGNFQVFDRRYGVSKVGKVAIFAKHLLKARLRGE
jgi:phytoene synthase